MPPSGSRRSQVPQSITPNGMTKALAMSFPFQRPLLSTILVPSVAANGLADSSTSMNDTPRESEITFLRPYGGSVPPEVQEAVRQALRQKSTD